MGLLSSSKKTTQVTDRRIAATEESVVATEGANVTIERADLELAADALDFAEASLGIITTSAAQAATLAGNALQSVTETTDKAVAAQASAGLQGLDNIVFGAMVIAGMFFLARAVRG